MLKRRQKLAYFLVRKVILFQKLDAYLTKSLFDRFLCTVHPFFCESDECERNFSADCVGSSYNTCVTDK